MSIIDVINSIFDPDKNGFFNEVQKANALIINQGVKSAIKQVAYNPYNDAKVTTTQQKTLFDCFSGNTLNASKWDITTGNGMTVTVNNGLTIATGTTINSETVLLSKDTFTVSHRVMLDFMASQKIANQECHIELVSVDANGNVEDSSVLDFASWVWEFAIANTTSTMIYKIQTGGTNNFTSPSKSNGITWTTGGLLEINATPDEIWFYTKAKNSAAARAFSDVYQSKILNLSKKYKLRIRVKNLATAPASSTTFTFARVTVHDYTEFPVEISGGVGAASAGESIPVNIASGSVGITGTTTVTPANPTSLFTTSAGSTNATSVKATAGNLYCISVSNTSATAYYLKLYNKASAPTVGTDIPVKTITIAANSDKTLDFGTLGHRFTNGIALAITAGIADSDTTNAVASVVKVITTYI